MSALGPFERLWIPEPNSGCYLWLGNFNKKYPNYPQAYYRDWATKEAVASRVAWIRTYGPIPKGMRVLHKCDNPMCVCPDHLYLGTSKDNTRDMIRKGRHRYTTQIGEAHPRASITEAQAKAILASTDGPTSIARRLGISLNVVRDVRYRKTWRHVR
jgi:HNH endonuclease